MDKQNIRIKLRAYDNKILDQSTEEIVNTVKRTGANIKGLSLYLLKLKNIQFWDHLILIKKVESNLKQELIKD